MPPSLQGRAQQAASPQGSRCRNRSGMLHEDCLTPCWRASRQEAAAGVEQGRAQEDEQPLDDHLPHLVERLKPKRYRATLVRRPSLPHGDGPPRPLGRPAGEAKRLPRAGARLLAAISAQDCLRSREGSRPQGGALEAGDTRPITRQGGRDAWVVAAALTPCCDTSDHDWRVRRCAARLEDGARLRLIRQWRHAGGSTPTARGSPQCQGPRQGGRCHPSSPMCSCTTCSIYGLKKWSNGPGEAKRGGGATPTMASARSQTKQRRNASPPGGGDGWRPAAWRWRAPRHGSSRAVGTARQAKGAASFWAARCGGARTARGTLTARGAPPASNSGAR